MKTDTKPRCPWCGSEFNEPDITPAKYTVMGEDRYFGSMTCSNPECGARSPLAYGKHMTDVAEEAIEKARKTVAKMDAKDMDVPTKEGGAEG